MYKPTNTSPLERALRTRALADELGEHLASLDDDVVHLAVRALLGGLLDRTGVVEISRDEDGHRVWQFACNTTTVEETNAFIVEPVVAAQTHARGLAASVATIDRYDEAEVAATRAALRHVLQAARNAMGTRWASVARVLVQDLVEAGGIVGDSAHLGPDTDDLHVQRFPDLAALERAWGNVEVELHWPTPPG